MASQATNTRLPSTLWARGRCERAWGPARGGGHARPSRLDVVSMGPPSAALAWLHHCGAPGTEVPSGRLRSAAFKPRPRRRAPAPGLPDGAIVLAPHLWSILGKLEESITGSVRGTKGRVSVGHAEVAPRQTTRAPAPAKTSLASSRHLAGIFLLRVGITGRLSSPSDPIQGTSDFPGLAARR